MPSFPTWKTLSPSSRVGPTLPRSKSTWFKRLQLLGAKRSRRDRLGECRTTALFPSYSLSS